MGRPLRLPRDWQHRLDVLDLVQYLALQAFRVAHDACAGADSAKRGQDDYKEKKTKQGKQNIWLGVGQFSS